MLRRSWRMRIEKSNRPASFRGARDAGPNSWKEGSRVAAQRVIWTASTAGDRVHERTPRWPARCSIRCLARMHLTGPAAAPSPQGPSGYGSRWGESASHAHQSPLAGAPYVVQVAGRGGSWPDARRIFSCCAAAASRSAMNSLNSGVSAIGANWEFRWYQNQGLSRIDRR